MTNKQLDIDTVQDIDMDQKVDKPQKYNVLLLNDNYTPMEFVVGLIVGVFRKNEFEATQIMLQIHEEGKGVVGTYVKEIAEEKKKQATQLAEEQQHPLRCVIEPADNTNNPKKRLKP